jgi:hypothetical protein
MAAVPNEIEALQQQMQQVRMDLGDEVHDLVENARAMTDWRLYWRRHPLAWCGAAAVLGYLAVPRRTFGNADARSLEEVLRASVANAPPPPTKRLVTELAGMAMGFVAQRGMKFLGDQLQHYLHSHPLFKPRSGDEAAPGSDGKEARTDHE